MPKPKHKRRGKKFDELNLSMETVRAILKTEHLSEVEFRDWFFGQTGPLIEHEDGTLECGVYGHDLARFIDWKKGGPEPVWD